MMIMMMMMMMMIIIIIIIYTTNLRCQEIETLPLTLRNTKSLRLVFHCIELDISTEICNVAIFFSLLMSIKHTNCLGTFKVHHHIRFH